LKEDKGNFQFVNGLFGGSIPKEFVPAIQKGFETAMTTGCFGRLSNGKHESEGI